MQENCDRVEHPPDTYKTATWNQQLVNLPAVVRCRILSFLEWENRILAGQVIPSWHNELHASFSWAFVEFNNWAIGLPDGFNSAFIEEGKQQQKCIEEFGKYFQHVTIALSVFDVQENSHGVQLLNKLSQCCPSLKSLRIYHEFMFCTFEGKWEDYLLPLKNLCKKSLRHVELCSLDDCPRNIETKNCKFFEVMQEVSMCERVNVLEFTLHSYCHRPVKGLSPFNSLHTLKAEHSSISTAILQDLSQQNLKHVYLVRDQNTEGWTSGKTPIRWYDIKPRRDLEVHLIFDEIRVGLNDFAANPFLVSITLRKVPNALSRDVLRNIAALYANSLQTFAHLSMLHPTLPPYDDMESLPCDYYYFASQCRNLRTFVAGIPLPCEAVWCLAMKADKLQNLHVQKGQLLYNYRVCLPVPSTIREGGGILDSEPCLSKEVSHWMGFSWVPLTEEELCEKTDRLLHF
ncbi:uncharacterized protein LOC110440409 [Mizuhopecten yessoensis]|uniref:F-box domain-containing protein n=1 Tax=Mizuhopecten yessoensis TaxID=6573 RepID=A0A210PL89_MIZYE|nr:uncharacterized protein LOC110440409 [Mizuhopecten yessoensis]OWF37237.1 hypothetical protein KP79_PYT12398 [Mizuhopecten yessoensis]